MVIFPQKLLTKITTYLALDPVLYTNDKQIVSNIVSWTLQLLIIGQKLNELTDGMSSKTSLLKTDHKPINQSAYDLLYNRIIVK